MYVYHFQYYQISKFISLFFTLYMTNINFFIMPFILCCNLLSHILLVFVYFYRHLLISIFSIFLFFFVFFCFRKTSVTILCLFLQSFFGIFITFFLNFFSFFFFFFFFLFFSFFFNFSFFLSK